MTQGSIWRQLVGFFPFPWRSGFCFSSSTTQWIPSWWANSSAPRRWAAVGSTSSIINMLVGLSAGLSTGASVIISQCYGARDHRSLHDAVHTTILATFIMSLACTAIGVMIVEPMLAMMSTPDDVMNEARTYLTIYFCGHQRTVCVQHGVGHSARRGGFQAALVLFALFRRDQTRSLIWCLSSCSTWAWKVWPMPPFWRSFFSALLVLFVLTHDHAPYGIRWRDLRLSHGMLRRISGHRPAQRRAAGHHVLLQRVRPELHQLFRLGLHGGLVQL